MRVTIYISYRLQTLALSRQRLMHLHYIPKSSVIAPTVDNETISVPARADRHGIEWLEKGWEGERLSLVVEKQLISRVSRILCVVDYTLKSKQLTQMSYFGPYMCLRSLLQSNYGIFHPILEI